jgi:hypothetical protein
VSKLKLVDNADQAAKMWSNRGAASAAVLALQETLPVWEGIVPENVFAYLAAIVATGSIFLRLMDQGLAKKPGG